MSTMKAQPLLSPVEVEIARGRLQSIVNEGATVVVSTAFSQIVREAKDFACALLTPNGDTIVQESGIPPFLGTATNTAKGMLDCLPPSAWQRDAVVGTNDPWMGTGHLFDLTLMQPIYMGDELVAVSSVVLHLADIGGRGWGREARQVFEEGFRIPPMVLGTTNGLEPMLVELLRANVRLPDEVIGDIEAALNALAVMGGRFGDLCVELTPGGFASVCAELETRTEAVMRERISSIPDGRYRASFDSDQSGETSFHLELCVVVDGDEIIVDFEGSSPQVDSGINCCRSYARGYAIFALKCLLAPDLPLNEGLMRPLRYEAPEGSVVNSRFPAAGNARNIVGMYVPTLILRAMSEAVPDAVIADSGSPEPLIIVSGTLQTGELFSSPPLVLAGGMGARATSDGLSVTSFPTNLRMVGVETIEATSPMLFACRETIDGSGGSGRYCGGRGQRLTFSCHAPSAQAAVLVERLSNPSQGLFGGGAGTPTGVFVNGSPVHDCERPIRLDGGRTTLTVESPGGGGYGDPATYRADD